MVSSISVLGSTGSIGRQTLNVCRHLGVRPSVIGACRSVKLLEEQAREFKPDICFCTDEAAAGELKAALRDTSVKVIGGIDALIDAAVYKDAQCVVTAVSGSVGLKATMAAIREKKRIGLANKETLVCAGDMVMEAAEREGAEIVPVDSEHSAIFQCLNQNGHYKSIILTGSGGPFRGMTREETFRKTAAEAVRHPKWNMGAKISVDSATMMNKGLEFIEAMHLFKASPDDIRVVVHPQSIIHSAVELPDGAVIAQLGVPDMEIPIQLALTWPERKPSPAESLDFFTMGQLTFMEPDLVNTPCLSLAMDCAHRRGTAACVMSAANEEAVVGLFLQDKISFGEIYELVQRAVDALPFIQNPTLDEILELDTAARQKVKELYLSK